MSPVKPSSNLAARMGRWSAAHWKTATFGWLAFVLVAFAIGGMVGTKEINDKTSGPGESGRADRILDAGFKQPAGESVLIQSRSLRVGDRAFTAAIEDVVAGVSKLDAVKNVRSPLDRGNAGQISPNRHAAIVEFDIRGDADKAVDKIQPVIDRVDQAKQAHPQFFIGEFGDASAAKGVNTAFTNDLQKAGTLSVPITMIILVIVFGALVAAGIPLLLALTAVFATFGLVELFSHVLPAAKDAPALVLLIGLAVGVDYTLFYLKREREERARGRSERAAIEAAAATSGRSVLISGLTVMVAMAGMFLTGDPTFISFAVATMIVVAVAVLGSLTVLPALLSRLGDKVDRLRMPFVGKRNGDSGRIWGAVVDRVMRRPLLSAALAGGLLIAVAVPATQLDLTTPGVDTLPRSLAVVKTYDRMQGAFPGKALPAQVVVKAPDVNAPAVREAIVRLKQRALASGRMHEPITVDVNKDATVANITVPIDGNGTDAESKASLAALRGTIVPATVGAVPDAETGVTGLTAEWKDSEDELSSTLPLVVGFVLVFAFVLLLVAFRSLVIAAKAIVLNILSVGAAYGILVLVFQYGVGNGFLGLDKTSGIDPVVPLLLFVILFGLSMDYHVFLLSRIREAVGRGARTEEAVSQSIRSTAGVVTSAAVVMVAVFAVFGTLSMVLFKQFGVGLAAAILIDATIVRAVLLPASMKLLGEWNWYLPRWLEWLPRFEFGEPEISPEPAAAPDTKPAASDTRKKRRVFTPARIVGLVLVGLAALGLAYLRFAPEAGAVSVPKGSHAGQLILKRCSYDTEKGSYAADCGTLVVPENRADPQSRLIALPVKRIRARSAHPAEPIFRLEGGPGLSNIHFSNASRFAGRHDVVLVGYRGVDGSVRLDCPEVESALKQSTDLLTQKSFDAQSDALRSCSKRLQDDGIDLAGYTLPQRVDDLEAARRAFGYGRIDLLSESAGTRTAMIYAWRYPNSIHRSVMIGANPPGHFLWDGTTTDEQIRRYAALCAQDEGCRKRTGSLARDIRRTAADMPDRFWFFPIEKGNARLGSFWGLVESTSESAPLSAPMTLDSWMSASEGDPSGLWFVSLMAKLAFPAELGVWGDYAAVARTDAVAAKRYFSEHRAHSILGDPGTEFLWAGGGLLDAWPSSPSENEYTRVQTSKVETLLVGGTLDFATPPQIAKKELLPYLPNGHQVVLSGFGHTTTFWNEQPAAGTRLINTFLDTGRADTSLYRPQKVDFTPEISQTALGKGIAGTMIALAALTLLSLLAMARRVRKRGRFGRKSSATLRAVYPIVLGLGGWFLGVLIAITTMPSVPLDNELLATLSVGLPVGLGLYYAWVNRDWSAHTKTTGFATVVGGALAGAWLGFHVTAGLPALITAIVGAAVGGNLLLLLLDIRWDRKARDRFAGKAVPEAVAPTAYAR